MKLSVYIDFAIKFYRRLTFFYLITLLVFIVLFILSYKFNLVDYKNIGKIQVILLFFLNYFLPAINILMLVRQFHVMCGLKILKKMSEDGTIQDKKYSKLIFMNFLKRMMLSNIISKYSISNNKDPKYVI